MSSSKADEIKKAMKAVTRAVDGREDMQLISASHLNCQTMLSTAPMTVAVLGHLTLVTLHKDVPLHNPSDVFKHIKYPDSLRASTVQLANDGWSAFNLAEKNMDQIRIYTSQIPNHIKLAVQILLGGTKQEVTKVMPLYLENVKKASTNCVEKAAAVEKAFLEVQELTQELQEACVLTQGEQEKKIERGVKESERKTREIETSAVAEEEIVAEREKMRQQIEEAKLKYEEQVESMPGAVKLTAMAVADSLCKLVSSPAYLFKGMFSGSKDNPRPIECFDTYLPYVSETTKQLLRYVEDGGNDEDIKRLQSLFEQHICSLPSEGPVREKLEEIYKVAITVTTEMLDSQHQSKRDKLKQEMSKIQGMLEAAEQFKQTLRGGMPMSATGPRMSKIESSGPLDAYVKQAYFKVESAEQALKTAKEDYEKMTNRLEQEKSKSLNLLNELSEVKLDRIDLDEIRILMQKCLDALAGIREQWGRLVRFFQSLSNVIDCAMKDSLALLGRSIAAGKDESIEYGFSDVMIDVLYQQTTKANKIAFMTSDISGMYLEISREHLTDPLARIGHLLALDTVNDKALIEEKQKELTDMCTYATKLVGEYITKKKEEFDDRISYRLERINSEMKAVLPPRPEEDPKITELKERAIKEAQELRRQNLEADMDQYY